MLLFSACHCMAATLCCDVRVGGGDGRGRRGWDSEGVGGEGSCGGGGGGDDQYCVRRGESACCAECGVDGVVVEWAWGEQSGENSDQWKQWEGFEATQLDSQNQHIVERWMGDVGIDFQSSDLYLG